MRPVLRCSIAAFVFAIACDAQESKQPASAPVPESKEEDDGPPLPDGWSTETRLPPMRIAFPGTPELTTTTPPQLVYKPSDTVAYMATCDEQNFEGEAMQEFVIGLKKGAVGDRNARSDVVVERSGAKGFLVAFEMETDKGLLVVQQQVLAKGKQYCTASIIAPADAQIQADAFFASVVLN